MEYTTKNARETGKLGQKIGTDLVLTGVTPVSNVLALTGNLGSGKTTFIQGLAQGLGIKQRIISPTYIIVRKYDLNDKCQMINAKCFYHIDLYRLEGNIEKEVKNLGLEEIWSDSANIVAIEWAERVKELIPRSAVWIEFKNISENQRKVIIKDTL